MWLKPKCECYTEEDFIKDVFEEGYADRAIFYRSILLFHFETRLREAPFHFGTIPRRDCTTTRAARMPSLRGEAVV
jgi:hypothetical protein